MEKNAGALSIKAIVTLPISLWLAIRPAPKRMKKHHLTTQAVLSKH